MFANLIVLACLVLGSFAVLITAVAILRADDALTRNNSFSPATALGMPLIVLGSLIAWSVRNGWNWFVGIEAVFTVAALVLVSSVGSNVLARATYLSGAELSPLTKPNALAADSADGEQD